MNALALGHTASAVQSALLKVIQGPNKGDTYRIHPPGVVIGRDPEGCQISLSDERVSRQQCRIDFKYNGIFIEDLSGKSSTFVNLQSISLQILASGDQLGFGNTIFEIVFENTTPLASTGQTSGFHFPRIPSITTSTTAEQEPFLNKKNITRIGFAVVLLVVVYILSQPDAITTQSKIADSNTIDQAIESAQKRQDDLRKQRQNETPQDSYNKRSAEKYFLKGFRDYQNKSYTRAIESFQTALSVQPRYMEAKRYLKLSEKKRLDLIDAHMDLGNKYKGKSMYNLCVAEFGKVLQIINRPEDRKYQLAKEQIQECRLLLQGTH